MTNTDDSFTMDNSNSFLIPLEILPTPQENKYSRIFKNFFLLYPDNVRCVYSSELPH